MNLSITIVDMTSDRVITEGNETFIKVSELINSYLFFNLDIDLPNDGDWCGKPFFVGEKCNCCLKLLSYGSLVLT